MQTDLDADRQVANTLAELVIGGSLASVLLGTEPEDTGSLGEDEPGHHGDAETAA